MGRFLSVRELCALLPGRGGGRMSMKTARRLIAEGRLPAVKIGSYWLVPRDAVEELLGHPLASSGPGTQA